MRSVSLRGVPAVVAIVISLLVGATSGAVAHGLITSAQIKDNSVRSVDIKDGAVGLVDLSASVKGGLSGPGSLSGYSKHADESELVEPGATVSLQLNCPDGEVALGGSVDWASEDADVTASYMGPNYFVGRGRNTLGGPDFLLVSVACARVGP